MTDTSEPAGASPRPAHQVLRNRGAVGEQVAALAALAHREIVIFAPRLDPQIFNTTAITDCFTHFVARDHHNFIHVLVEDAGQAVHDNDRLVGLCRRLSDFVKMRRVDEPHLGLNEMFMVADHQAYVHQLDLARPECVASNADRRMAAQLALRFGEMWERSHPIPTIHVLGL